MKTICKTLGGSHSYGLSTAQSDIDYRGVFLNDDIATLIGLNRHEHQQKQDEETDEVYTEFRNALRLLKAGNTQMIELLFNDNWIELKPEWELVIRNRDRLIDAEQLFKCLKGYMQGELKLANGERTGKLGGKRKAQIEKYGFSPKNFVQLLRLGWAGTIYFQKSYFPVDVFKENTGFGELLLDIKTRPEKYSVKELNDMARTTEAGMIESFETRKCNSKFDEYLANRLCFRVYGEAICQLYNEEFPF